MPERDAARLPSEIGPYRVLALIGAGGMGTVYRAVRSTGGQEVALKTLLVRGEPFVPAIRREISALAALSHPGIPRIVEVGSAAGAPWVAMEFIAGQPLSAIRKEVFAHHPDARRYDTDGTVADSPARGASPANTTSGDTVPATAGEHARGVEQPWASDRPSPWGEGAAGADRLARVLDLGRKLCAPLAYLHGEGFVHRDVKPDNVIVTGSGSVVLVDFGLATAFGGRTARDTLNMASRPGGTVAYMAPEVIAGDTVDARADLYAMGCLLYELLTGRPPFFDRRVDAVLRAHLHRAPAPPSQRVGGLPAAIDDLVLRLLAKEPRDRLGYAEDVAARLEHVLTESLGQHPAPDDAPRTPRRYLYRPSFVGRTAELATIDDAMVRSLDANRGGVTLVVGESGVGKTRFVLELARRAGARRTRVLMGECPPPVGAGSAAARPLQPLLKPLRAIADECAAVGAQETERVLLGRQALLETLASCDDAELRALAAAASPPPSGPDVPAEARRARVAHEIAAMFGDFAARGPVLLVMDDLQWADDLTLAFLERLALGPEPAHAPLFAVVTVRAEEIPAAVEALARAGAMARVDLLRLENDAISAMASDMLALQASPLLLSTLASHAEGNPFFAAEYLRAAMEEGMIQRDASGRWRLAVDESALAEIDLPRTVHDLVCRRLADLPAPARTILDAASVAGREADFELLRALTRMDDAALDGGARELVARHLLSSVGVRLRFTHDKVREAVYSLLDDVSRSALHRSAATALEAHDARPQPAVIASHWLAAGEDVKALGPLLLVAREARDRCANAEALRAFEHAHRVLRTARDGRAVTRSLLAASGAARTSEAELPDALRRSLVRETRREVLEGMGEVLVRLGRADEALEALGAARALATDAVSRATLMGRVGGAHFAKGDLLAARRAVSRALSLLRGRATPRRGAVAASERGVERLRARLLNRLAYIEYSFDIRAAIRCHELALRTARKIPDAAEAAETLSHHGPLFASTAPRRARRYAERAVEICVAHGHTAARMPAELMAGVCAVFQARWPDAVQHFKSSIALYDEVGDVSTLEAAYENLAYAYLYVGSHEQAIDAAERALRLSERIGDIRGIVTSLRHLATAWLRRGDLARAREMAELAVGRAAHLDDHVVHVMLGAMRGELSSAEGRWDAARDALEAAVARAERAQLAQEEVARAYVDLTELRAAEPTAHGGEPPHAMLRLARRRARPFPAHRAALLRAEGMVAASEGRTRSADQLLREAAGAFRSLGMRYEMARTWERLATLRAGKARQRALRLALEGFGRTSSQADAARVRAAAQTADGTRTTLTLGSSR